MTTSTKVSISEAARMAGISRQTLYRQYINKGRITVESIDRDAIGQLGTEKVIDTSEILRVFGKINGNQQDATGFTGNSATENTARHTPSDRPQQADSDTVKALMIEIEGLRALMAEKDKRIEERDSLLEKKDSELEKKDTRIMHLETRIDNLLPDLTKQKRGLLRRLFGG